MFTRDILLYLAKQASARDLIMGFPLSRQVATRFIAGEDMESALRAVQALNGNGHLASLDFLGEDVALADDAYVITDNYLGLTDAIAAKGIDANLSLKLTQLGLKIGHSFCQDCVTQILEHTTHRGNFVRIDMEDSALTDQTLNLYRDLRAKHHNVGIVIQSYLYRSAADVDRLIEEGNAHVRLCKGAYQEPASVAYPLKLDVDRNYIALMEKLLSPEARAKGSYVALATHDSCIINLAKQYVQAHNVPRDAFEFQMLYGVRRDLQRQLAAEGYRVRIYVPYGQRWYPYFMRRLAERPANILFLARAIVTESIS
jgi:proline dehydrogenase